MNDNTLVAIFGYAGDAQQIKDNMVYYQHHKCPVVVLSPVDAPVMLPGIECKQAGKRAYIGVDSIVRQKEHLQLLLQYPQQWFLMNDSDSVVLSSRLPDYLYREPGILWSNEVSDMMHVRPAEYGFPRLAFQPPYFCSKDVLEKLVQVADSVPVEPQTPFIDWCMMAWAIKAGIPHQGFPEGASCGTTHHEGYRLMEDLILRHGRYFIHSIKTRDTLLHMARCRAKFIKKR